MNSNAMRLVKPTSPMEKVTNTVVDTKEITPKLIAAWKSPPFQRDMRFTPRVQEVSDEIRANGGVVSGIITLGVLEEVIYIIDGQHRLAAFLATGLLLGYADVRTHWFDEMGAMATEYVRLNSRLVQLRPDDILRGMEPSSEVLQRIRRKCPFIGYDMVRRSQRGPVVSMSLFVRTWQGTKNETPAAGSAVNALNAMDEAETSAAIEFAGLCFEAWRRDVEHGRLWSMANLTLCAWLYRRIVLGERMTSNSRTARFTKDEFRKCLMALAADPLYLDYLVGRNPSDRDRAPTYARIKTLFQTRYHTDTGKKVRLPSPAWAHA